MTIDVNKRLERVREWGVGERFEDAALWVGRRRGPSQAVFRSWKGHGSRLSLQSFQKEHSLVDTLNLGLLTSRTNMNE